MACVFLLLSFISTVRTIAISTKSSDKEKFTVVIDAGHGGKDIGCHGNLTNEKTITLAVARKLGARIKKTNPEVDVVYTRDKDEYLTLNERAQIANKSKGDLFISIHVNSVDRRNRNRRSVQGASVYTLGLHKSDNNLAVAMRENSVMALDNNYEETYSGFDPNSSESYIIFELNQNAHLAQSLEFANAAQKELVGFAGREDKDVRQAGFWVLWATSMPAVLVELDFICNPVQERFLHSDAGKDKCAEALCRAFTSYYRHSNGHNGPASRSAAIDSGNSVPDQTNDTNGYAAPLPDNTPSHASPASGSAASKSGSFHIQLCATDGELPHKDRLFKVFPDLKFYRDGDLYKYYTGTYTTSDEAKKSLFKIKKSYPQAFIIKLAGGQRVNF